MAEINLNKKQANEIAHVIYPDTKAYCRNNFERYFPWFMNEVRKEKGKPPLKPVMEIHLDYTLDE